MEPDIAVKKYQNIFMDNVLSMVFPSLFMQSCLPSYVISFWGNNFVELFPNFLQNFTNMVRLTLGVKLLKNLSLGIIDISTLWIILILTLMITGLFISVKTFRWE